MTTDPTTAARSAAKPLVIERTYQAPVEELWALWTTKAGFESWWGPQGFRADVYAIEARVDGPLHYAMVADTPEMVAAMAEMGRPPSHDAHARFSELVPNERLTLRSMIDFLPGVPTYESEIGVTFAVQGTATRMVVTIHPMHDEAFTRMSGEGFTSQLGKLDARFGWKAT